MAYLKFSEYSVSMHQANLGAIAANLHQTLDWRKNRKNWRVGTATGRTPSLSNAMLSNSMRESFGGHQENPQTPEE